MCVRVTEYAHTRHLLCYLFCHYFLLLPLRLILQLSVLLLCLYSSYYVAIAMIYITGALLLSLISGAHYFYVNVYVYCHKSNTNNN